MKRLILSTFFFTMITTFLCGCSVFGIRSNYEQLDYTIIEKIGEVEVRQYPARLVAEVNDAQDDNAAFMLLFRYISGQNTANQKVAMTAPVQVKKESTNIAMTSPVEVFESNGGGVNMRFFLPNSYTIDSAPTPNDPRINIISLPAEKLAAITYSGWDTEERFLSEKALLLKALDDSRWQTISAPTFLGYDPPFAIPFLRRNEVIVKVESAS